MSTNTCLESQGTRLANCSIQKLSPSTPVSSAKQHLKAYKHWVVAESMEMLWPPRTGSPGPSCHQPYPHRLSPCPVPAPETLKAPNSWPPPKQNAIHKQFCSFYTVVYHIKIPLLGGYTSLRRDKPQHSTVTGMSRRVGTGLHKLALVRKKLFTEPQLEHGNHSLRENKSKNKMECPTAGRFIRSKVLIPTKSLLCYTEAVSPQAVHTNKLKRNTVFPTSFFIIFNTALCVVCI